MLRATRKGNCQAYYTDSLFLAGLFDLFGAKAKRVLLVAYFTDTGPPWLPGTQLVYGDPRMRTTFKMKRASIMNMS